MVSLLSLAARTGKLVCTFIFNSAYIDANIEPGYFCCFFLIVMGIFSKFAAALVAIPAPVLGGMTTFLFCAVAVSGIRIISTVPFTRRNRFILTAALAIGFGATLVPDWFSYVFTYSGGNTAKQGFFNAIELVCETGFAITAFIAIILNLMLSEEPEDDFEETRSLNGDADRLSDDTATNVGDHSKGKDTANLPAMPEKDITNV
jgi:uric acid-xanthine permease